MPGAVGAELDEEGEEEGDGADEGHGKEVPVEDVPVEGAADLVPLPRLGEELVEVMVEGHVHDAPPQAEGGRDEEDHFERLMNLQTAKHGMGARSGRGSGRTEAKCSADASPLKLKSWRRKLVMTVVMPAKRLRTIMDM